MGPRTATLEGDMTPEAIGARLALIREAFGLSKAEIADMLDIDRTHWSRFEGGQRAIPYDKASRLVVRFGVTLDFIILGKWGGLEFATAERLRKASA
jgi:transcriptional regulator with XRE-family HTH domain